MNTSSVRSILVACVLSLPGLALASQAQAPSPAPMTSGADLGPTLPADYVIGPEDVLGILFWRENEMSGDVTVRPDGVITLPLIGDVRAAGLKPDALREVVQKAAGKFLNEVNATVVVRQVNSRKVFITGEVTTPGAYPLIGPRTVMQLIALAGGLTEFADAKSITVMRNDGGKMQILKFNYREVSRGRSLEQNLQLRPGDTVVVP